MLRLILNIIWGSIKDWFDDLFTIQYKYNPKDYEFPLYHKGTVITCPCCHIDIATANEDIYSGQLMSPDQWDSEHITQGSEMQCHLCTTPYLKTIDRSVRLHTSRGWK